MAHKKAGGSSRNGRDSSGQRLGVKKWGGEAAIPGNILVRQCGTKWHPGVGVRLGRDFTIYAIIEGKVAFSKRLGKTYVGVVANDAALEPVASDRGPEAPEAVAAE